MILPISHNKKSKLREVISLFHVHQIKLSLSSNIYLLLLLTVAQACVVSAFVPTVIHPACSSQKDIFKK